MVFNEPKILIKKSKLRVFENQLTYIVWTPKIEKLPLRWHINEARPRERNRAFDRAVTYLPILFFLRRIVLYGRSSSSRSSSIATTLWHHLKQCVWLKLSNLNFYSHLSNTFVLYCFTQYKIYIKIETEKELIISLARFVFSIL